MKKYSDTGVCSKEVKDMSIKIVEMEDSFDYSMRGFFIDRLMCEYVENLGKRFIEMYEFIVNTQTKEYDDYGDIDTSVGKIKVTGDIDDKFEKEDSVYSASGIYLRDIFSGNYFIIIKREIKSESTPYFNETEYHVRKLLNDKSIQSVSYNKFIPYGDFRDDNYVVSYKKQNRGIDREKISLSEHRGMSHFYPKFKELMDAIRQPYIELKEKIETNKTLEQ